VLINIFGEELNTFKELVGDSELVKGIHEFLERDFVVLDNLGPSLLRSIIEGDFVCACYAIDDGWLVGDQSAVGKGEKYDEDCN
jgi:hypothetical protein